MAKSRNDILFKYLADTKNLERGNKRVGKSMGGVTSLAKKAGGALAIAFGGREVLQFGKDAIDAAADYEESINAVEVSTGDAADEIFKLGETAAQALGLSKTEVNEAAVAFAAFGEKINADDVGGVFEEFIGRATDFASVMNLDVGDALVKFQSGLAGESEPLRRFGLDLSAASVSAFAVAEGIHETGKNMSEEEKVLARYGVLLQQTDKFAGDFENTADSLVNTQKRLTAEFEDAKVEIGKELMPVYHEMVTLTAKTLPAAMKIAIPELKRFSGAVDDISEAVDAVANRDLPDMRDVLGGVRYGLEQIIPPLRLGGGMWDFFGVGVERAVASSGEMRVHADELPGELEAIRKGGFDAASGVDALNDALDDAAPRLRTMNELVEIFSGDLFGAARAARDLSEQQAAINLLLVGGGGSGEVADPDDGANTKDAIRFDDRINGSNTP